jgi:NAD(P)-dependent dehydrogenase (short-subunit alcohol dehydrogenase family)
MKGRVTLITGAAGGLGSDVVQAFVACGARVFAAVRRSVAVEGAETVEADLASDAGARHAVHRVLDGAGRLDCVVHLMGGFDGGKPIEQTGDDTWRRMLDVNLNSTFYMLRAALPHVKAQSNGRVIAVGSRAGVQPLANFAAYSASKAALHALVQAAAAECKGTGATVNAVLPSIIDTPANREAMPGADYSAWVAPEQIAELLVWLASDASAGVNGALIPIYGGA